MVKTAVNAFRSSKFSTLIRSRGCWIKWRCQNCSRAYSEILIAFSERDGFYFVWQPLAGLVLRMHTKVRRKTTKLCLIAKISVLIIGTRCRWKRRWQQISDRNWKLCRFCACAKKMSQHSCKWFPIAKVYRTTYTYGSKKYTRNILDCDQSSYSSRIIFSCIPTKLLCNSWKWIG